MTATFGRPERRNADESTIDGGFTVVEVMVSSILFAIVATAAITGIVNSLQSAHASQRRIDASNVAQSFIASAQANTTTITAEDGKAYTANVLSERFDVRRWVSFSNAGGTQCSPGATFTVSVTVADSDGKFLARSDSVVTC
jgi:prepilin-type N-terminal cleavage/methylation domain-containing protein